MKHVSSARTFITFLAAILVAFVTHAENWNQYRGPNGDGKSQATNLPVEFSETENVRWKTPIHDMGWSSPVVWDNQIWVTAAREDGSELFAICVDLESGKIIHDIKVFDEANPQVEYGNLNTHASPTPVIEEGRLYVHYGTYGTACLDTKSGKILWERRDLNTDHVVRPASSPILDGDSLIIVMDGLETKFITALDKETGETLWLTDRQAAPDPSAPSEADGGKVPEQLKDINSKSYATPSVIEYQGLRQIVCPGHLGTFSYNADTGEELWRIRNIGWNVACRPVFYDDLVYVTTGSARNLQAVRITGKGDVTDTHIVWSAGGRVSDLPSPLIIDGLLFMVSDQGGFTSCMDAKTGELIWRERAPGGGTYWASPSYADGKIYLISKNGSVTVISAGRQFDVLAENKLEGEFIASPAVADDAIILRSTTHLYCIAK